jgi:hypothetical protein
LGRCLFSEGKRRVQVHCHGEEENWKEALHESRIIACDRGMKSPLEIRTAEGPDHASVTSQAPPLG